MPITELRIEGLRTIEKLRLKLDGLTVLIGDNGSGKSSIIEACELLRRATGPRFMEEFYSIHGGLTALLRQGAPRLSVGVTVRPVRESAYDDSEWLERDDEYIEYDLALVPSGSFAMIEESIRIMPRAAPKRSTSNVGKHRTKTPKNKTSSRSSAAVRCIKRLGGRLDIWVHLRKDRADEPPSEWRDIDERVPYLATLDQYSSCDSPEREAQYVAAHLLNVRVHLPFEVMPAWAARALDRKSALRGPVLFAPADHLEKLGLNLPNAYHALRNSFGQEHWKETLDYIRLGLGEGIEDVTTWADPGGGNVGLAIKRRNLDRQIPAAQLSDGMLSYLAFVALFRLRVTPPALLAMDEPDLHLHPHLLMRVLDFFEAMARDFPVLVATHSDRLLDGLSDPARAVVLCEIDEHLATRLIRPDRGALEKWLERYRGLGDLRGAGHAASVLTKVEPT